MARNLTQFESVKKKDNSSCCPKLSLRAQIKLESVFAPRSKNGLQQNNVRLVLKLHWEGSEKLLSVNVTRCKKGLQLASMLDTRTESDNYCDGQNGDDHNQHNDHCHNHHKGRE